MAAAAKRQTALDGSILPEGEPPEVTAASEPDMAFGALLPPVSVPVSVLAARNGERIELVEPNYRPTGPIAEQPPTVGIGVWFRFAGPETPAGWSKSLYTFHRASGIIRRAATADDAMRALLGDTGT